MTVSNVKVYKGGASDNDCGVEVGLDGVTRQVAKLGFLDMFLTNGGSTIGARENVTSYTTPLPVSLAHYMGSNFVASSTTPGTPVQFVSEATNGGAYVYVKARTTNVNTIYVGFGGVSASLKSGYPLEPGEPVCIAVLNAKNLWMDVITSGDGVSGCMSFASEVPE